MPDDIAPYQVFAVKYAERQAVRGEHFLGGDPHHDVSMPMDYFVWAVDRAGRDVGGRHRASGRSTPSAGTARCCARRPTAWL